MDVKQVLRTNFSLQEFLVAAYLADLSSDEWFARPVPGINPIAWQIGHLITSEWSLVEKILPGKMDPLPEGFAQKHSKETSGIDDPAQFLAKEEYLTLAKQVRQNTLRLMEAMTPADLDLPVANIMPLVKTNGDLFLFIGTHWIMHSGQWAVFRRSWGRPPLF